jgi:hypothetical protein
VKKENICLPPKNSVLEQVSKVFPAISPSYGVNSSVGAASEIF